MGAHSTISWTDATWNPVVGCTRVSPGCDHCYAFALHDKRHASWRQGRWPTAPAQYHRPFSQVQLLPDRLSQPVKWRAPRRIFVNALSDLFHGDVPDDFIGQVFHVMAMTSRHTYQILTKRPERMRDWTRAYQPDPLPNVWLGVSAENQFRAETRIPLLLDTPAAIRFISAEPLLGPIDLRLWLARLDWIIAGGESGPRFRTMDPAWARSLRDQSESTGVAFFYKQGSARFPSRETTLDGREWHEFPEVGR